jgi:hypothetical protein
MSEKLNIMKSYRPIITCLNFSLVVVSQPQLLKYSASAVNKLCDVTSLLVYGLSDYKLCVQKIVVKEWYSKEVRTQKNKIVIFVRLS